MNHAKPTTVDQYLASFPPEIAQRLEAIRKLFHEIHPEVVESISYGIPAFSAGGNRLYMAGYKNHIGFYPVYDLPEIEEAISPYRGKGTKDSLHFRHTQELPLDLIRKIILLKQPLNTP